MYRRALVIIMAAFGNESDQAGSVMSNLAVVLEELGRFKDAEELFRKCLDIKKMAGSTNDVASAHCLLGGALKNNGNLIESESHYREAVGILRASYGDQHESIEILNRTLALFPKLNELKAVELQVEGQVMNKADPSWSSVLTEPLQLEVVCAEPLTAHVDLTNAEELNGKAALVIRGESSFSEKVTRCAEAGAKVVIIMSSDEKHPDAVFQMGAPEGFSSPVPAFMVSNTNGQVIRKLHSNGNQSIQLVPPS
jgi:tetratricopeptide (TPR) repeat protein